LENNYQNSFVNFGLAGQHLQGVQGCQSDVHRVGLLQVTFLKNGTRSEKHKNIKPELKIIKPVLKSIKPGLNNIKQ
jgi:hypothetical protein